MTFESILGAWCVVISLSFIWPQVWRVYRHDSTFGLSPTGNAHSVVGSCQWLAYGIVRSSPPMYLSNISFLTATIMIASKIITHGAMKTRLLLGALALGAVIALVCGSIEPAVLGWAAIVISSTSILPQTLHVIRTHNLHGISIPSYVLTLMSSSSWMLLGFVSGDLLISAPNFVLIPCALTILLRAHKWQRDNPQPLMVT